jgi:hypothetical protein
MQTEAKESEYIIINNFKVFTGLPVICKKTMEIVAKLNDMQKYYGGEI